MLKTSKAISTHSNVTKNFFARELLLGITLLVMHVTQLATSALAVDAASSSTQVYKNQYVIERITSSAAHGQHLQRSTPDAARYELITVSSDVISRHRSFAPAQAGNEISSYVKGTDRCPKLQKMDPSIVACSPNFVRRPMNTPNDPFFIHQWSFSDTSFPLGSLHVDKAWNISTGSKDIALAVIDSGYDYIDPELAPNVWTNPLEVAGNGLDDDGNGYVDDVHGIDSASRSGDPYSAENHGNHIAGIIGAKGNNERSVAGINWDVTIIPVKAVDPRGFFTTLSFARAVDYLIDLKQRYGIQLKAVNASFGGYSFSEIEYRAIARLQSAGILLVAAAGNESSDNDAFASYPASYQLDNIISVGASDENGNLTAFSNFGLMSVDIAAPGQDILSTAGKGSYEFLDGTSMSTPFVVGAIGLVSSVLPDLDYHTLRSLVLDSAQNQNSLAGLISAHGILDIGALLERAQISKSDASNTQIIRTDRTANFGIKLNSAKRVKNSHYRDIKLRLVMTPSKANRIPGVAFLQFAINRFQCPQLAQIDQIDSSTVTIRGHLRAIDRRVVLTATVYNGESIPNAQGVLHMPLSKEIRRSRIHLSHPQALRLCQRFVGSLTIG